MPAPVYRIVHEVPSVEDYCRLRREAGLSERSPDAAARGLPNTLFGVSVRLEATTIGMGRIVGDGGCCYEIVDVAVLPSHQRQGLGNRIVTELVGWLRRSAPSTAVATLLADGEAHRLYARFGFVPAAPGSRGMLLRL